MGLFSRRKDGIKSKANAALDKAIDPEKEVEMAILELEEQRKKALAELISYKATAKQMENDQKAQEEKAATWEKRAMTAVKAGDDLLFRMQGGISISENPHFRVSYSGGANEVVEVNAKDTDGARFSQRSDATGS